MNFKKYISQKTLFFTGVVIFVAPVVFIALLYANFGFLNLAGYFDKTDPYKNNIILFFHSECSYCTKVDDFMTANKVEAKIAIVRLNVDNAYNANVLADKAQICGLDASKIGVPFLWNGLSKKCVIGYIDIISFLKQKVAKP